MLVHLSQSNLVVEQLYFARLECSVVALHQAEVMFVWVEDGFICDFVRLIFLVHFLIFVRPQTTLFFLFNLTFAVLGVVVRNDSGTDQWLQHTFFLLHRMLIVWFVLNFVGDGAEEFGQVAHLELLSVFLLVVRV